MYYSYSTYPDSVQGSQLYSRESANQTNYATPLTNSHYDIVRQTCAYHFKVV